ncbi:imidazoleglycerol-phosphate dehydratase HisB [Methanosalsum natronophilum]|nr:imidazoleglycerol-phosphate dehydratase HisB [Methanosalsum natronophilum]MCS3924379.1 imidazoleglycerol-phosphate dehydratase [Methanosalsum natronophilum]
MRSAQISRNTNETRINIEINLDGKGNSEINTGIGFFNHMLTSFSKHSGLDMVLEATGDIEVDEHHLVEDCGIVIGQAIRKALDNKAGIVRFGEARIPMDEAIAEVSLDLGGRSYLVMNASFDSPKVGDLSTQMVEHFFESIAENSQMNIHASVLGKNDHHMIEALFKAFARSLKMAVKVEGESIPSTKGKI